MPKPKDSGRIELRCLFLSVQDQMLANLASATPLHEEVLQRLRVSIHARRAGSDR